MEGWGWTVFVCVSQVKHRDGRGRGVFTTTDFDNGQFVCEYAGELISSKEAKVREESYCRNPAVGCYMYYFQFKEKTFW